MKYILSSHKPQNQYLYIEFIVDKVNAEELFVELPAWRPGRYELANFAKNIQKWEVTDQQGKKLSWSKTKKDGWKIATPHVSQVHIKYTYYAAELNAGSSFLDGSQLYVNPVNCFLYVPDRMNDSAELVLQLPEDYKVAAGFEPATAAVKGEHYFNFKDFHELADSPFIASNSLQHETFINSGVEFHLWFQGDCKPDWPKLKTDFSKFVNEQMETMQVFPIKNFHFLIQMLPYKTYHGVEHLTSTVITLGPGADLMKEKLYEDLLGVSSHELFHVWNVKSIRPIEMQPYDYSRENYSRLGYVYEGVTTYYGDCFLFRSGVFSEEQYFKTISNCLQKHVDNFGRFNLSVADSSFDTWLDGYVAGVPNRKTSIYNEGCLMAFVTDMFIRKGSNNEYSLDDVMRYLNVEFALKGKGYSEKDYQGIIEHFSNASFDEIADQYLHSAADYAPILKDAMAYVGCEMSVNPSAKYHEHALGIKISALGAAIKVQSVYPDSVSEDAGLSIADEIIAVNKIPLNKEDLLKSFNASFDTIDKEAADAKLSFTVISQGLIKEIGMHSKQNTYFKTVEMKKMKSANQVQIENFEKWSKNKF